MKVDKIVSMTEVFLTEDLYTLAEVEEKLLFIMNNAVLMNQLAITIGSQEWHDVYSFALRKLETRVFLSISPSYKISNPNVRDWLTNDRKEQIEWQYWNRYKEFLSRKKMRTKKEVSAIDDDTNRILSLMADPQSDNDYGHKGLVVGDVQSGKTANYAGLICKAIDAGYRIIIVIAGVLNDLRAQTQERLEHDVIGKSSREDADQSKKYGVGSIPSSIVHPPQIITTREQDFHINKSSDAPLPLDGTTYMLVIKKNASTLRNVIKFFSKRYTESDRRSSPVFILDDEADNASVNSNAPEENPTRINALIKELLGLFPRNSYVGYTATPYANIFIDPYTIQKDNKIEHDLFPSDFIYSLGSSSKYFGATKLFCKPDEEDEEIDNKSAEALVSIDEQGFLDKIKKGKYLGTSIPDSLEEALYAFVLARAIRDVMGQEKEHCSMLIHVSLKTSAHTYLTKAVKERFEELKEAIISNISLPNAHTICPIIGKLKAVWDRRYANTHVTVSWEQVVNRLSSQDTYMYKFKFFKVNSTSKRDKTPILDYTKYKEGLTAIVIGGNSLSRGLTIEGLTTTYFLRPAKQYDTLMQMGRWFGYRPDYEEVCRIYISEELQGHFAAIAMATDELKESISYMDDAKLTPMEFGLRVRNDVSGLTITSRNKMRAAQMHDEWVSFSNSLLETFKVSNNSKIIERNLNAFYNFLEIVVNNFPERVCGIDEVQHDRIWKNVPASLVWDFISSCEEMHCTADPAAELALKATLREYLLKEIKSFDVALVGVGKMYSWTKVSSLPCLSEPLKFPSRNPEHNADAYTHILFNKQHVFSKSSEFGYQKKRDLERLRAKAPNGLSGHHFRSVPGRKPLLLLSFVNLPPHFEAGKKLENYQPHELTKTIPVYGLSFPKSDIERPKWIRWAYNSVAQKIMEQQLQACENDFEEEDE